METINERIQWIIDTRYHGNKKRFASDIGITPSTVDGIVGNRKSAPSYQVLRKISTILNISAEWLVNGGSEFNQSIQGDNNISLGMNLGTMTNHLEKVGGNQLLSKQSSPSSTSNEIRGVYESIITELTAQLKAKDEQLKAKDEQLKAKDEQLAQMIRLLDSRKK